VLPIRPEAHDACGRATTRGRRRCADARRRADDDTDARTTTTRGRHRCADDDDACTRDRTTMTPRGRRRRRVDARCRADDDNGDADEDVPIVFL
jgi:hypothetical protein